MHRKSFAPLACVVLTLLALSVLTFGQDQARTQRLHLQLRYAQPITHGIDRDARAQAIQSGSASSLLPVWNFQAISSRDGRI